MKIEKEMSLIAIINKRLNPETPDLTIIAREAYNNY